MKARYILIPLLMVACAVLAYLDGLPWYGGMMIGLVSGLIPLRPGGPVDTMDRLMGIMNRRYQHCPTCHVLCGTDGELPVRCRCGQVNLA